MKTFFPVFLLIISALTMFFITSCVYEVFYPVKYKDEIIAYSQKYSLAPELVASIINVESGYREERISNKGAKGLMQIMPSTAEWIAKTLNESFNEGDLFNAEKNIKYGAFYLSYLKNYFKNLDLAICAYNAGMGNVREWIKNEDYFSEGRLIKIPFKETENYLKNVKKNIKFYESKY